MFSCSVAALAASTDRAGQDDWPGEIAGLRPAISGHWIRSWPITDGHIAWPLARHLAAHLATSFGTTTSSKMAARWPSTGQACPAPATGVSRSGHRGDRGQQQPAVAGQPFHAVGRTDVQDAVIISPLSW